MADDIASRIEQYRSHDDERHKFIEELFQAHQGNVEELTKVGSDLEIARNSCRAFHDTIKKLEASLKSAQQGSFVLVLLDADTDGYFFEDALITKGLSGGIEAANRLHRSVRDRLQMQEPGLETIPLMIKAYIYLDGAREAFRKAKLGYLASQLPEFITGFNQVALCDFVCVGSGKDRVDEKIRSNFELFLKNPACRHIAFAACHDNGYTRVLEQIHDDALKRKITLIEGFYTGKEFQGLGIRKTKVQGVFRMEPLHLPGSFAETSKSCAVSGSAGINKSPIQSTNASVGSKTDAKKSLKKKLDDGNRYCIAFLLRGLQHPEDTCEFSHGAELSQDELEVWKDGMSKRIGYER